MLALAKLHLANGDVDGCQQQCVLLLKHYPNNEEAAIMLAELMFHKVGEGGGGHHGRLACLIIPEWSQMSLMGCQRGVFMLAGLIFKLLPGTTRSRILPSHALPLI